MVRSGSGRRRPISGLISEFETKLASAERADAAERRPPGRACRRARRPRRCPSTTGRGWPTWSAAAARRRPVPAIGHGPARDGHGVGSFVGGTRSSGTVRARASRRDTAGVTAISRRGARARRWQCGQKYDDRFMNASRGSGCRTRSHGGPAGRRRSATVEVAGLAVDVDVQRVERRAADGQRLRSSPRWPRPARSSTTGGSACRSAGRSATFARQSASSA